MNRSQYYIMRKKHEDYLMHHGVDGQKWGVKHGPPYPLDDSQSTGSRLKTKKKKKKQINPEEKAAIERGGRFGLIGATVADLKYKHDKKKKEEAEKVAKSKDPDFRNMVNTKLKNAKYNDSYDSRFLETIQNDWYFTSNSAGGQHVRLDNYRKYLIDKDRFIKEHKTQETEPKAYWVPLDPVEEDYAGKYKY